MRSLPVSSSSSSVWFLGPPLGAASAIIINITGIIDITGRGCGWVSVSARKCRSQYGLRAWMIHTHSHMARSFRSVVCTHRNNNAWSQGDQMGEHIGLAPLLTLFPIWCFFHGLAFWASNNYQARAVVAMQSHAIIKQDEWEFNEMIAADQSAHTKLATATELSAAKWIGAISSLPFITCTSQRSANGNPASATRPSIARPARYYLVINTPIIKPLILWRCAHALRAWRSRASDSRLTPPAGPARLSARQLTNRPPELEMYLRVIAGWSIHTYSTHTAA